MASVLSTPTPGAQRIPQSIQTTSDIQGKDAQGQKQQKREGIESGNLERENTKAQAISVLHEVIDRSDRINDWEIQATLISNAFDLLWKHEELYASSNLQRALDRFFLEYSSRTNTTQQRNQIVSGIKTLTSCLAKHDPEGAAKALDRFGKLTEELSQTSENLSPRDRLAVAQSSLDVNARQSAMLAARLLSAGVPGSFPDYLYQLEIRDEEAATDLYRTALSQLAGNPIYTPNHATILSAYAFREKLLVLEIRSNDKATTHIEFGSLTNNLSPPPKALNLELARAYLSVAYGFLAQRLFVLQPKTELDQEYLVQCYFLAKKLSAYAGYLNLNEGGRWEQLGRNYELLGLRGGLTNDELGSLARLAERLVAEGSIFQFDDGASAFEKAKTSKNREEKTALLVRGIHELLEAGKFAEAEQKIGDIEDDAVLSRVMDYFHFRIARAAIRKRKWQDMTNHTHKIVDQQLATYLFLEAAEAAFKSGKKDLASEYLQSAMSMVSRIDDQPSKAKALVALSGLLVSVEPAWSNQSLLDAARAMNQADSYDGANYSVTIELPKLRLFLPLNDSDLNTSFERSAKTDWPGTISAASTISRSEIRAMAQIAACRSVL
jgi:hypothetical protein